MRKVRLGEYIESFHKRCGNNNAVVSGIDINKQFINTRANLEGTDISKYYLVPPHYFACNFMHIGRDERIPISLNKTGQNLVVTSAYYVFHIKEDKKNELSEDFLNIFSLRSETDRLAWFYTDSSIRGNLNENRFLDMEFPLPSLDEQKAYVAAWQGLKELADNNAQMADPLFALCQSYLKDLKQKYPMQEIGPYLAQCDERNNQGLLGENDVRGLATSKQLIETKANLDGVSLSSYKLLKAEEFAFVPDTSRRGDKMSLGFNREAKNYIVSSISCVFRIKDKNKLLPDFLYLWFSRPEFDRYARFNSWGSARETFSFSEMCRVKIPLPPIEVQKAIVAIYRCAQENKAIAGEAAALSKSICPALMRQAMAGGKA